MSDWLLTHVEMMAELWDLGFGLEGMEGREPTQKERFVRIIRAQDAKTKRLVTEWLIALEKDEGIVFDASSLLCLSLIIAKLKKEMPCMTE